MTAESKAREQIAKFGRQLYQRGLVHGTSGNISLRLEDGWLITPTNTCMGELDPAAISKVDQAGNLVAGEKPSKEAFLHLGVYEVREEAQAIVHTHSTHSVAVSCMDHQQVEDVIPPITAYYVMKVGKLPLIPYFKPGDKALAGAVKEVAADHAAVLLANHGPVVAGKALDSAVYALEELEETAKLFLLLDNKKIRTLTPEQVAELQAAFPS